MKRSGVSLAIVVLLALGGCAPAPTPNAVPYRPGCEVASALEWVPGGEPAATPDLALERLADEGSVPGLPRSGWTLVDDTGTRPRVYASGGWGVEVAEVDGGWQAVSATTCRA